VGWNCKPEQITKYSSIHSSTLTVPCQLVANKLVFHVEQEIVQQIGVNHCIHLTIGTDTQMECDLPICCLR